MLLILAMAAALTSDPGAPPSTAAQAPAAPTAQAAPTSTSAATDDSDKVVCRNEPITGSKFTRRICATRAQWRRQEENAQEFEHTLDSKSGLSGNMSSPLGGGP